MSDRRILRVFPRRTSATPIDARALINEMPGLWVPECDEVHVSCAFTWDIPKAEELAEAWRVIGVPVHVGGPAFNAPGGDFVPGRYVAPGYVITSRGCPNKCWFCAVPKREGNVIRELPICDGFNILDDNLLACSESHIRAVFAMLARQPQKAEFTGGLEAARLTPWVADELAKIRIGRLFFAYDTPGDWEPLVSAVKMLKAANVKITHDFRVYVLVGWPKDTIEAAESRLVACLKLGLFPMAMLYRDRKNSRTQAWMRFQREWAQPISIGQKLKALNAVA